VGSLGLNFFFFELGRFITQLTKAIFEGTKIDLIHELNTNFPECVGSKMLILSL
jgi:hypothetical protein